MKRVLLRAFLALTFTFLPLAVVNAAALPSYVVEFVAPARDSVVHKNKVADVVKLFNTKNPGVVSYNFGTVRISSSENMQKYCSRGLPSAVACYSPRDKLIYLSQDYMQADTIVHELVHATIVDGVGSVIGYKDAVEEGIAEAIAVETTGRTDNLGYPDYYQVIQHLTRTLQLVTENDGVAELRKVAFIEGKGPGINSRLGEYSDSGDVYLTLNYYLKEKKYDEANQFLTNIANNFRNSTKIVKATGNFVSVDPKIEDKNATTALVTVEWKVTNASGYKIAIVRDGTTIQKLAGSGATGKATFNVPKPYKGDVQILLMSEKDGKEIVLDERKIAVDTAAGTATVSGTSASSGGGGGTTSGGTGGGATTGTGGGATTGTGGGAGTGVTAVDCSGRYKFTNTLFGQNECAGSFFQKLYIWAVGLAIVAAVVTLILAGYKYVVSRDPAKAGDAKEMVIGALTGLLLLLLSYSILNFLGIRLG